MNAQHFEDHGALERFAPGTRRIFAALGAVALAAAVLAGGLAGIVVAPTALYMDQDTRSATLTLYNPGPDPAEISVEAVFGFPTTDEVGRVRLLVEDPETSPVGERSAAGWIRAFPRRTILAPGERQRIRLLAEPPPDLPDGEYWSRVVVTSRGGTVPVTGERDEDGIRIGLDLEVRTIVAATFRMGEVATAVEVEDFTPRVEGDSLVVRPLLRRTGQAAYIGRIDLTLSDGNGEAVREWQERIAVYDVYHRRYAYPLDDLPPGEYRLRLAVDTERDDVPDRWRLPSPPLERTATVRLP